MAYNDSNPFFIVVIGDGDYYEEVDRDVSNKWGTPRVVLINKNTTYFDEDNGGITSWDEALETYEPAKAIDSAYAIPIYDLIEYWLKGHNLRINDL